jgi:chemotaxis protein MotB
MGKLRWLVVLGMMSFACGVPKAKYQAVVDEAGRNMKSADDQRQRADACEAKERDTEARAEAGEKRAAELTVRLTELENAATAATADASQQRELVAQLAKSKELLEAQSASASAEAERQRQLAEQLQQEKSALQAKSKEYESLAASLDTEIKAGRVKLSELQGKLTVRMGERVLFPSGSATISADGKATLRKIADAFASVQDRIIRVEGHTDNVPIHTERFPSNWELSAARAIAVVRYLQERGIDPKLLGAAGYGEYQPIASNDTADGRAENRRIEISLAAPLQTLPATSTSAP